MKRSIPPRTMQHVSRSLGRQKNKDSEGSILSGFVLNIPFGGTGQQRRQYSEHSDDADFPTSLLKKPRNWKFQTRPFFKKIKGPLVDVFHEADEVLIVIDLGGFRRGDVSLTMSPDKFSIVAKRGDQEFQENIALPPEFDIGNSSECFRNGVLEIILQKKTEND